MARAHASEMILIFNFNLFILFVIMECVHGVRGSVLEGWNEEMVNILISCAYE